MSLCLASSNGLMPSVKFGTRLTQDSAPTVKPSVLLPFWSVALPFTSEVGRLIPDSDARYYWILPVNADSIRARDAEAILARLQRARCPSFSRTC